MTYYDLLKTIREGKPPREIILYKKRKFVLTEDGEYVSDDEYQMRLNSYLTTSLTDFGMARLNVITLEGEDT